MKRLDPAIDATISADAAYQRASRRAERIGDLAERLYADQNEREEFASSEPCISGDGCISGDEWDELALLAWLELRADKVPAGSRLCTLLAKLDRRFANWCDGEAARRFDRAEADAADAAADYRFEAAREDRLFGR